MTTLLEPPTQESVAASDSELADLGGFADDASTAEPAEADQPEEIGRPSYVALAAATSSLGAAWLAAHLFHSVAGPFLCGLLGVFIGAGFVWLSTRFER